MYMYSAESHIVVYRLVQNHSSLNPFYSCTDMQPNPAHFVRKDLISIGLVTDEWLAFDFS